MNEIIDEIRSQTGRVTGWIFILVIAATCSCVTLTAIKEEVSGLRQDLKELKSPTTEARP